MVFGKRPATLVLVKRGADGRLGIGLNDGNYITELSEAAKACGLALLDQVCTVDGVDLGGHKMQTIIATLPAKDVHGLRIRRMPQARRDAIAKEKGPHAISSQWPRRADKLSAEAARKPSSSGAYVRSFAA